MTKSKFLTAPVPSTKMPPGMPYILTNEAAERFAFYGMSSILVVFMTKYLMGPGGVLDVMGNEPAKAWFHWFTAAVYFMAIVGAVISDVWRSVREALVLSVRSTVHCEMLGLSTWTQRSLPSLQTTPQPNNLASRESNSDQATGLSIT